MTHTISRRELFQAQAALFVAIALQVFAWRVGDELLPGSQYVLILTEVVLAILLGFTANFKRGAIRNVHHALALSLLALITFANIVGLMFVLNSLVVTHADIAGQELLAAAIAIFMTNIIIYALWYWEIDSPGLTRKRWSRADKDFQFSQQDMSHEFPGWSPQFIDYLYLAITNAVNFAPADTRPLTHSAKILMASQALVSVFTLALVIARSVSVLGT